LEKLFPREIERETIKETKQEIENLFSQAYGKFKNGLKIHDDLEKVYIEEMDFQKADFIAEEFIENLLKGRKKSDRKPIVYERLFGTNTADGVANVVEQLIDPIKNRVFIKGRAGTGKSYFMRKVLEACLEHGLDVEMYRCS